MTQGCEDASHQGDENSKLSEESQNCKDASRGENSNLNEERQNTQGGDEDNNAIFPVITVDGFRQRFKDKIDREEDHKPSFNVPSMPMITTVRTLLTA